MSIKNQETPTPTPLGSYPINYVCCAIIDFQKVLIIDFQRVLL